jgi:tyrocidine synthetase-3
MRQEYSQKLKMAANQGIKEREYWLEKFSGELAKTCFPPDYKRKKGSVDTVRPLESVAIEVTGEPLTRLSALSKGSDYTLNLILVTAVTILLSKYSGSNDIIIGMPIYKQEEEGDFINRVLALRNPVEDHMTVKLLLLHVRQTIKEAVDHLNYPVEILVEQLGLQPAGDEFPLFDAAMVLKNIHHKKDIESIHPNMIFCFRRTEKNLGIQVEYNPLLYREDTVQRIARHLQTLLKRIPANPEEKIGDIGLLSDEEKKQLLLDVNDTVTGYPANKTLHRLFEEQAARTPDGVSIVGSRQSAIGKKERSGDPVQLTYKELNKKSGQLAEVLKEKGVLADNIVAIMLRRSIEMIIGILGILKTGSAYLPIDPDYPEERIDYMLKDSNARILLKKSEIRISKSETNPNDRNSNDQNKLSTYIVLNFEHLNFEFLNGCPSLGLSNFEFRASYLSSSNLAYIIYTSGTTGKPRGVLTTHRNAVRVVKNTNYIEITPEDRVMQISNYAFDGSIFDIFGALLNGAVLVLTAGEGISALDCLSGQIKREQVTVFFVTTALFNALVDIDIDCFKDVEKILFGGERVSVEHARKALQYPGKGKIIHMYGPTETTVYAAYYFIDHIEENAVTVPIGKPIANTAAYILDNHLHPVPVGVHGELYIGGPGLARGYLNQPELTAEKFDHDLWDFQDYQDEEKNKTFLRGVQGGSFYKKSPPGRRRQKLYKTGDLVRWLPDGNIEFVGRRDFQVKIRGFRIEPGEIEGRLLQHENIEEAVVLERRNEKGDAHLCAYVVPVSPGPGEGGLNVSQLRDYLSRSLPAYMIPAFFVLLEKIPLNPNGKLDKKALPEPAALSGNKYTAPVDEVEEKLVGIWSDVLGRAPSHPPIGIDDNFFEIGGHSLKATEVISRVHKVFAKDIKLREFFSRPFIRELAKNIREAEAREYIEIQPVEQREYYDLSYAQRRLWVLCQFEAGSAAYNMPGMFPFAGRFDGGAFEQAVQTLIRRHEILRTVFVTTNGQQKQEIIPNFTFRLEQNDLRHLDETAREKQAESIYITDAGRAFDLENGPLFRFRCLRLEEEKFLVIFIIHHIISDGWSQGIIRNEILTLYNAFLEGKTKEQAENLLPPLKLQYKDYTCWHNGLISKDYFSRAREFWLEKLRDKPNGIELPTDHPRKPVQTFNGKRLSFLVNSETMSGLDRLRQEEDATVFMGLLSLVNLFLYKYTGQADIIVGAPIAGRRQPELHHMTGFLVNTLVYRNRVLPLESFRQHLRRVRKDTLACYDHQDYPFDLLVDRLELDRDLSRPPLFNVMLAYNNTDTIDKQLSMEGLSVTGFPRGEDFNMSKFDLTFFMNEVGEGLAIRLEYNTDLFEQNTIRRMADNFLYLAEKLADNADIPISQLHALHPGEYRQVTRTFNDTRADYPRGKTIRQLFEEQAAGTPDGVGLVGSKQKTEDMAQLTYKELNEQSNQLARVLVEKGVKPDTIVGLMVGRSIEMIIGILGILKAGGAYLPIEPGYPEERIEYMLKDSNAGILLKKSEIRISKSETNSNDQNSFEFRASNLSSSNLSYIIYTSGTTGKPKGVMVEHGGVFNTIYWRRQEYGLTPDDRVLQLFSFSFDGFVTGFFTPIVSGSRVVLPTDEEAGDVFRIKEIIISYRITHFICVPSLYASLLETCSPGDLGCLRVVTLAGEGVKPSLVEKSKRLNPNLEIVNEYGATENTVVASVCRDVRPGPVIPIGKPTANTKIYILDRDNHPVPIGAAGELCIAGAGVARGYLNRPELTAKKFIFSSYRSYRTYSLYFSKKLYKSGDLARWLPDGNIEFRGRIDHQVKIRGFRIELGEIEGRLLTVEGIKEAVVIDRVDENGEKSLCAYIVSNRGQVVDTSEVRSKLSARLPGYMVPAFFMRLERMPLTPFGKVDRRKLPEPEITAGKGYAAPLDAVEEKLLAIWADILNIEKENIGINTSFFDVGGHSLKAAVLTARVHQEFNVKIPLTRVFNSPTIKDLSGYIRRTGKERHISIEPVEEKDYYPLSSAQKRLYILHQFAPDSIYYNMPYVIEPEGTVDKEKVELTFKKLAARHESLRASFETVNEEPVCSVHREVDFYIEHYEMQEAELEDIIPVFTRPFDLGKAPLLRVKLIIAGASRQVLFIDMHHIITDGTSHDILSKEFAAFYSGREEEPPPLKLQYKDYSQWLDSKEQGELRKKQEVYWLREFAYDGLPVLNLPTDFPRPFLQSFEGNWVNFTLSTRETEILKDMAKENDVTLYMILLAIFNVLFSKLSGQEDIVLGTPIAGRRHSDLRHVIGMMVNTLPMRNYPSGDKPFDRFLKEVKQRTLDAYENQEYPFEELVGHLSMERDTSRNPLFDIMLNLLNLAEYPGEIPETDSRPPYHHKKMTSRFDMTFNGVEIGERIFFGLEYSTRLFTPGTIERFIGYLKNIILYLPGNTGQKLVDIDYIPGEEKEAILGICSGVRDIPGPGTIPVVHRLFEEKAGEVPDRTALVFEDRHLGYGELNERAHRLACFLKEKGVLPDDTVGMMIERSPELIIGILGILKAGGAYLPVDPDYPQERIDYMLKDSGAKILLTNLSAGHLILHSSFSSFTEKPHHPGNLVYVIYTSGSTGRPKGVMMQHGNLVNLIRHQYEHTDIDFSRVLQFATISFDVSAQEIFSTLLAGGRLVLIAKQTLTDLPGLFGLVEKEYIKTLFVPASFLKFVMNEEEYVDLVPGSLEHVVAAGEQVIVNKRFREYLRENSVYLHNHYGPSETHGVTMLTLDPGGEIPELPCIGRPIANTDIYIVDNGLHLVPPGVAGELVIEGKQVGRGYLNRPELTAERFVLVSSKIIYKTGDLARWLHDGNLEFLGRMDHQVKIRGFRVELGEIESRLLNHGRVTGCVVVAREDERGGRYLCAYMVSEEELEITELREYLGEELPDYMVPSYFVFLDKIPLTPNRKVDRRALPSPEMKAVDNYIAPGDPVEEKLAGIWAGVLKIGKDLIGVESSFFELGGHSLTAVILAAKIHKEFQVKIPLVEIFRVPTLRGLSRYLRGAVKDKFSAVEPVEKKEYYALSSAQGRLYFIQQMAPNSIFYNLPQIVPLDMDIHREKLEDTFGKLISRHESLRTSFETVKDQPVQRVREPGDIGFSLEYYAAKGKEAEEIMRNFVSPFDLSRAPLLRAALINTAEKNNLLLVDMHHTINDGTSQDILSKEFLALAAGEELPGLKLQYKDYSDWQNSKKQQEARMSQEEYWLREFSHDVPVLTLPLDFPRPVVQGFEGAAFLFVLDKEETSSLYEISGKNHTTLFMTLFAIFNVLFYRLSGQEDIVLGTVVSGRRHADLEKIIGMLVNTLALRNHPAGKKSFTAFLAEVKAKTLAAFENQDYPFEDLVEKIPLRRDAGRNPVFDVMVTLQNQSQYNYEYNGESPAAAEPGKTVEVPGFKVSKFDITLNCVELGSHLLFNIEYCTKLFKRETIQCFTGYLQRIISSITRCQEQLLSGIELLTAREKEQLLYDFNDTYRDYATDTTIHRLFAEQVERTPDGTALHGEDVSITYKELNKKSDQVAHLMRQKGVGPDTIVGLMMGRSIEMIIGILGILKAGGAYLPIDPEYPDERKQYMLTDSGAKILLTNLWEGHHFHHSSNQLINHHSGNLAYVIYTSGSTGRPKGTMIEHRSLVNQCTWHGGYYEVTEADHCTQYAGFGFDASVFEIFPYLTGGAALHIIHDAIKLDMLALKKYYVKHDITITFLPTQFCRQFMEEKTETPSLRAIITGGEKLGCFVKRSFRLYNNYGPTENTVVTTVYPVEKDHENIPIGRPVYNNRVFILDKDGFQLQPIGVPGELCISGHSLSRGYLNNPELTAEKFDHDLNDFQDYQDEKENYQKFLRGSRGQFFQKEPPGRRRLYRTGDLARWLPDGNIEFLGRIDQQVKIRGFRIELGEIENRLRRIKGIEEAVVIARMDTTGHKYLCGYVTGPLTDTQIVNQYLSKHLPSYMIPQHLVRLDKIPLTPGGKVNRKELPEPGFTAGETYSPPRNELDEKLVRVWSEVLGIEKEIIGIDSNFFELGGNSMKLMTINSRINQVLPADIPVVKLFTYPSIRVLSNYLAGEQKETVLGKDRSETLSSRRSKLKERKRR